MIGFSKQFALIEDHAKGEVDKHFIDSSKKKRPFVIGSPEPAMRKSKQPLQAEQMKQPKILRNRRPKPTLFSDQDQ